jgi:hypothetical protein
MPRDDLGGVETSAQPDDGAGARRTQRYEAKGMMN